MPNITALKLEVFPHPSHTEGKWSRGESGTFILTNVKLQIQRRGDSQVREIDIESAVANLEQPVKARNYGNVKDTLDADPRNGWTIARDKGSDHPLAVFALAQPLTLADDEELIFWMLHRSTDGDANIGRFRLSLTDQPGPAVRGVEKMPLEELATVVVDLTADAPCDADALVPVVAAEIQALIDGKPRQKLVEQYLFDHRSYQIAKRKADRARSQLASVKKAAGELNVMVLGERLHQTI